MAADSRLRLEHFPIPMAALLVLAPACYPDSGTAEGTGGDGSGENAGGGSRDDTGIISRPDAGGGGGGRPDTGGSDETNGGGGFDAGGGTDGGGVRPDTGGGSTVSGVERLAEVVCVGNFGCGSLSSTYYTTVEECFDRVAGNIREDIDDSDSDCSAAVAQYADCLEVEGDCVPDYYDQFLLETGECTFEGEEMQYACGLAAP
jgi:hypothetical protein